MLENIRKHTASFIVVLVLIFVGLIFLQDNMGGSGPSSGPVLVKTKDKNYALKDLEKAENEMRLSQRILQTAIQNGSFQTYGDITQYLGALQTGAGDDDGSDGSKRYLVHRTNFERARKEFGLYPSKDEIDLYQRENIFTGRDGLFDEEAYENFTDKGLKGLGMTLNDVNEFIGNLLAFKAFSEILGAGVLANEQAAQENFLSQNQQFTLSTLSLNLADFKKDLDPSEEEIKTYWGENKGRYQTEAKRKLTYLVASPNFDEALAKKKEAEAQKEPTPAEEAAEAEKTTEELAAEAEKAEEEVVLSPEERSKLVDELGLQIEENIWVVLQGQIDDGAKKAELEPLAEDYGYEVKTTELLPLSELPAEIRGTIRGSQRTVEQELASASLTSGNVMDSLSEILGIGTESWLLYRIDEAVDPTEKSFEEARDDAKIDLIQFQAEEALRAAIESAREEVAKAIAAGTPLNEAAAAQNVKLAEHLTFTANGQFPGEPSPQDIYRLAAQTKTGELSVAEVIEPLKDRGVFVFVKERTFVESEPNLAGLTRAVDSQRNLIRTALVQHWFTAQYEQSDVVMVTPKNS